MSRKVAIGVAVILLFVAALQLRAQELTLPTPELPSGMRAYTDPKTVIRASKQVLDQLAPTSLVRGSPYCDRSIFGCREAEYYRDLEYPKRKDDVWGPSPCELDADAMAVHRGWAWIVVGYRQLALLIENSSGDAGTANPTDKVYNQNSAQLIDRSITRFGRAVIFRVITAQQIVRTITEISNDLKKLPLSVRGDVTAFLKVLLRFKGYHDLLSNHDDVRTWMNYDNMFNFKIKANGVLEEGKHGTGADKLVARINSLLQSGSNRLNPCFAGYVRHYVKLQDGRTLDNGAIYSQGSVRSSC